MKKFASLTLIVLLVGLTSCINIIEEIFLNKDGSGKYVLMLDLKSMLAMKDMVLSDMRLSSKDSSKLAGDKLDSVIYLTNIADSIRQRMKHPELMERAIVRLKVDVPADEAYIALEFPFKNVEEVNNVLEDIHRLKGEKSTEFGVLGFLSSYKVTKKTIARRTSFGPVQAQSDSVPNFAAALFATARVKTIFHLPGKVTSTSIKEAFIRGNDCVVELTFPEFIQQKKTMDGEVKFK